MTMKRTVILAVTADEYELPVAVADLQCEMAQILGVTAGAISHSISEGHTFRKKYFGKRIRIVRVPIEEEDEDG